MTEDVVHEIIARLALVEGPPEGPPIDYQQYCLRSKMLKDRIATLTEKLLHSDNLCSILADVPKSSTGLKLLCRFRKAELLHCTPHSISNILIEIYSAFQCMFSIDTRVEDFIEYGEMNPHDW